MNKRSRPSPIAKPPANQRRDRQSFGELVSSANRRAHETANRRGGKRGRRTVWAAVAAAELEEAAPGEGFARCLRWLAALVLLPFCWVTTWTFLSRFSQATVYQDFWKTAEFWYFATGALLMAGWFWSGLLRSFFLYLYVLGHELTHAIFILLCRGKVLKFHVGADGGFVMTNKTNLVIALSPYFVPFWSVAGAVLYGTVRWLAGASQEWDRVFYAAMGLTWTFHMVWTLWMIPRDQPDLKENGTFLSLVIIYLANLLVLVGLLCVAADSPLHNSRDFALEWIRHAATWGDMVFRWAVRAVADFRTAAGF